ncbi:MAG: type II toxin-antitoxin system RelE/ParE family toxin [Acidobacteriota bacterium]
MTDAYRIEWSPSAVEDLIQIFEYIASNDHPSSAECFCSNILGRTHTLANYPRRCRIVPELKAVGVRQYRELIVPPYRILFRIDKDVVGIVGVLDGRRDLEELLIKRALEN